MLEVQGIHHSDCARRLPAQKSDEPIQIKKSMHKQTSSLSMEPAKKATMRRMRNASSQPSRA
jgi:hypothetical protein